MRNTSRDGESVIKMSWKGGYATAKQFQYE
jgi:hypothetical protein